MWDESGMLTPLRAPGPASELTDQTDRAPSVGLRLQEFDTMPDAYQEDELYPGDNQTSLVRGQGETEEDLEEHDPAEFQAALSSTDWTVETLVSQMRKGRIDLNPRFQRRNAWVDVRKSRLVESVVLRYPIPQLVLAEQPDSPGNYFVIDGKQRLLSLRQFCADPSVPEDGDFEPLKIRGLEVLTDLNGRTWPEIEVDSPSIAAKFENHTIRTVFISQWRSTDLLLSMFLRLNTGSVTLSPQELRQALKPGPFSDWLDERSIASAGLKRLLNNEQPDRRMVDAELLLRHLSLTCSPIEYRGNLKRFLDDSTGTFNEDWSAWEPELERQLGELEEAILFAYEIFPEEAVCRKWTKDRFERPFNRAIFDIEMLSFADPSVRDAARSYGDELLAEFKTLCSRGRAFPAAITSTTKTLKAYKTRFDAWHTVLRSVTGTTFEKPQTVYWK